MTQRIAELKRLQWERSHHAARIELPADLADRANDVTPQ